MSLFYLLLSAGIARRHSYPPCTPRRTFSGLFIHSALAACMALAFGGGANGQGRQLVVQSGHEGREVTCVRHSPNGKLLATAGDDAKVKVWDASTSLLLYTLEAAGKEVLTLAFAPDGVTLAAGDGGGNISIWDATTGQKRDSWKAFKSKVYSMVFHPRQVGRLIAIGDDGRADNQTDIKFWDATSETLLNKFSVHGSVTSLAINADGTLLGGSSFVAVYVWDAATGKERWKEELDIDKSYGISNVLFTTDGKQLLAAVEYTTDEDAKATEAVLKVWDVESGKVVKSIKGGGDRGHSRRVLTIALSSDGKTLATGGADSNIILWDRVTGREMHPLLGHTDRVRALSFSPDGRKLVSVSADSMVRVWELATDTNLMLTNQQSRPYSAAFSPDGKVFVSGHDGHVKLWDMAAGAAVRTLRGNLLPVTELAFSRDGKLLVALDEVAVTVWDHAVGELKLQVMAERGSSHRFASVAISPDGKTIAIGGERNEKGLINFWDVASGTELGTVREVHKTTVHSLAFSSDGKLLASGGAKGEMNLLSLEGMGISVSIIAVTAGSAAEKAGFRIGDIITRVDGVEFIDASALSGYLFRPAVGSRQNVRVRRGVEELDLTHTTEREITLDIALTRRGKLSYLPLPGHGGNVTSVAFAPDGSLLASADSNEDKSVVKLWDMKMKSEVGSLEGSAQVAFSPDGKWLARYNKGELKLWDVVARREGASVAGAQPVFDPHGRFLVGFDEDSLKFIEIATGEQVGRVSALGEMDWVVSDGRGKIDGSRGGLTLLHLREGARAVPLVDVFLRLHRPGLLAELLVPSRREKPESRRTSRRYEPPSQQPPTVRFSEGESGAPLQSEGKTADNRLVVSFEVSDGGGGIGPVALFLNGEKRDYYTLPKKRVETAPAYHTGARASVQARYEVTLAPGANEIKLFALNVGGTQWSTQSFRRLLEVKKEPGPKSPGEQYIEDLVEDARAMRESIRLFGHDMKLREMNDLINHGKELGQREQNYEAAQKWFAYALQFAELQFGPSDTALVEPLKGLVAVELARGHLKTAESLLKRALTIATHSPIKEIEDLTLRFDLSIALAQLSMSRGELGAAEQAYESLINTFIKLEPGLTLQLFPQFTQVALDYIQVLKAQGEEEAASEIILILYNLLEKFTTEIANDANLSKVQAESLQLTLRTLPQMDLIMYRGNREKFGEALENQIKAAAVVNGEESFEVMQGLVTLANFYLVEGRYAEAEKALLRAKNIKGRILPNGFLFDWMIDRSLAYLALVKGDLAAAREIATRSLKSFQQLELARFHPDAIMLHYLLALSYQFEGKHDAAEREFLWAFAASVVASGNNGPLRIQVANARAVLAQLRGDYKQAVVRQTETNKLTEENLAGALAIRSEGLKQNFLSGLEQQTDAAISLQVNAGMNNFEARRLALTAVLQRKGRMLDAMTGASLALRRSLLPADQKLFDDLSAKRTKLATLVVRSTGQVASEEVQAEIRSLEVEVGKLEGELSSRSKEFYTQVRPVTPELVQGALPKGAALVEFVRYRPLNRQAKSLLEMYGPPHYMVFVLPQAGQPRADDLGAAAEIDDLVKKFRAALRDPKDLAKVKEAGRNLDERVMRPVRQLLAGRPSHLFISPDGSLNLVPFAAMVDEQRKYLVQSYLITYLTSGRDLLRSAAADGLASNPVIVADPDFGASGAAPPMPEPPSPSRRRSGDSNKSFSRLANTARDAETLLKMYPNAQPLLEGQATEAALKKIRRPLVLHIATHGFFNEEVRPAFAAGMGESLLPPSPASALGGENPLLRSGLALAGANQLKSGDNEDGILTALEISALDLTGTKLVVLSACETGVGSVVNGEGIYGLRRALILAGSESQLISLWRVNDEATHELIIDYYNNLQVGEGRAEALRKAQFKMLGLLTGTPGAVPRHSEYDHPYFWSGFIQNGRWEGMRAGGH